jgi:hypothetical protein
MFDLYTRWLSIGNSRGGSLLDNLRSDGVARIVDATPAGFGQGNEFSPDGRRLALAMGSLVFLDTEDEKVRSNQRRLVREDNEWARPLVQRVLEKTTDPLKAREMILSGAPANKAMGNAALGELREKLDLRWRDAYKAEKLEQMLKLQILRQQLVLRADQYASNAQRSQLLGSMQNLKNLEALQRQALTEYANAKLNWERPDTRALVAEIVLKPDRSADDYLLAYFGMVPIARGRALDANSLILMAMAECRTSLFADALGAAHGPARADGAAARLVARR